MVAVETPKWGVLDTFNKLEELRGILVNQGQVLRTIPPYIDHRPEFDQLFKLGAYEEIVKRFPVPNIRLHAHWPVSDQPEYIRSVWQVFDPRTARLVCVDHLLLNGVKADEVGILPDGELGITNFENPEAATFFPKVDLGISFLSNYSCMTIIINTNRVEGNIYEVDIPRGSVDWKYRMWRSFIEMEEPTWQLDLFEPKHPLDQYTLSEAGQKLIAVMLAAKA